MKNYVSTEYFRYFLLDKNNAFIKELFCVESANVVYESNSRIKQKATINITVDNLEEIDINHRIRIIHVINGKETPIGTFLISIPSENRTSQYKTISLECHSTLWLLLTNKIIKRHVVSKGTNVVNEVKRMLDEFGLSYDIQSHTGTTSLDREWEIGTSYLTLINDLLRVVNYTSLYVDPLGTYIARPYILPENREIELMYDETDEDNILDENNEYELNLFDVPNIFVRYVNDPGHEQLSAVYRNENPQSITSIANRPPNPHVEEVQDVTDVQTLMDICKRDCSNATNQHARARFTSAINPKHSYFNCIYLNLNGVTGRFIEDGWEITCETGGDMKHSLRRVIIV